MCGRASGRSAFATAPPKAAEAQTSPATSKRSVKTLSGGETFLATIPAAFLVSALVGATLERGVIRFLYGRPLETLLATWGCTLLRRGEQLLV